MARRGAMWPTWLSFDAEYEKLGHGSQGLFQFLWMHPDLNSGGYITLAPRAWSRRASDLTIEMTQGQLDELLATNWVAMDDDTAELLVRPFIRLDSCQKPHIYVNAMRAVQTCRSPLLRVTGWEEIQAVLTIDEYRARANRMAGGLAGQVVPRHPGARCGPAAEVGR